MPYIATNCSFQDFSSGLFAFHGPAGGYGLQDRCSGVRGSSGKAGNGNCQNSSKKGIGDDCRMKENLGEGEST